MLSIIAILNCWITFGCIILKQKLKPYNEPPIFDVLFVKYYCLLCGFVLPIWPMMHLLSGVFLNWLICLVFNFIGCIFISHNLAELLIYLNPFGNPSRETFLHQLKDIDSWEFKLGYKLGVFFFISAILVPVSYLLFALS
jgi:hypothetical protein